MLQDTDITLSKSINNSEIDFNADTTYRSFVINTNGAETMFGGNYQWMLTIYRNCVSFS